MDDGFLYFLQLVCKDMSKYGLLVNSLSNKSVRVHQIVNGHSSNLYHLYAIADTCAFIQSVESPQHNVDICTNSVLPKTIEENRHNSLLCQVNFISWMAMPTTWGI